MTPNEVLQIEEVQCGKGDERKKENGWAIILLVQVALQLADRPIIYPWKRTSAGGTLTALLEYSRDIRKSIS